jgi:hypothetical protein
MIIRWPGKFRNIGRYVSSGIRAAIAVLSPPVYNSVALTLHARAITLTLETRSPSLTLSTRAVTLTLSSR